MDDDRSSRFDALGLLGAFDDAAAKRIVIAMLGATTRWAKEPYYERTGTFWSHESFVGSFSGQQMRVFDIRSEAGRRRATHGQIGIRYFDQSSLLPNEKLVDRNGDPYPLPCVAVAIVIMTGAGHCASIAGAICGRSDETVFARCVDFLDRWGGPVRDVMRTGGRVPLR